MGTKNTVQNSSVKVLTQSDIINLLMKREIVVGGMSLAIDPLFLFGEGGNEHVITWSEKMSKWVKNNLKNEREY